MHEIKRVSPNALKPNPRNARTHSKKQIRQIADSIVAFGFTVPLLIDENPIIIAGHGRLEAAKLVGLNEVPAIVLEGLSEAKKRALLLADNKIADNAGWDRERLAIELPELAELLIDEDLDISITGFEPVEIDQIASDFEEDASDPADAVESAWHVRSGGEQAGRPLAARQSSPSVRRRAQWRRPRSPHGPRAGSDGVPRSALQCAHQEHRRAWPGQAWRVRHGLRRDVAHATSPPF